jgi:hypothetical protein
MTDWNTGLADTMPRLKVKAKKMVRERIVLRREREELLGDNKRLFGELQRSKAAEAPAAAKGRDSETRLAMADVGCTVAQGVLEGVTRLVALEPEIQEKAARLARQIY